MENNQPIASNERTPASPGVPRRVVIKGAAWSVPVIAAAAAVPMASASDATCSVPALLPFYAIEPSDGTLPFTLDLGAAGANRQVVVSIVPARSTGIPGGAPGGGSAAGVPPQILPSPSFTADANGKVSFQLVGRGAEGLGDFELTITVTDCGTQTTLIHVADPADNNIVFWGWGGHGNIGDGTYQARYIPTHPALPSSMTFTDVGGSYLTSFAVRDDGKLFGWGYNGAQQLGAQQPLGLSDTPVEVPLPTGVSISSVIDTPLLTSAAIGTDGRLYTWGQTASGATGQGDVLSQPFVPVGAVTGLTAVTDAGLGQLGGIALDGGVVKTWGYNANGQLGNNVQGAATLIPGEVAYFADNDVSVTDVASSNFANYAVSSAGDLYAWGWLGGGALGLGPASGDKSIPTPLPRVDGKKYVKVWANYYTAFALLDDGSLVAWGDGTSGQFGDGALGRTSFTPVRAFTGITGVVEVAISLLGAYVRTTSGDVYYSGHAFTGQAGNGSFGQPNYWSPVKVYREGAMTAIGAGLITAGAVQAA